MERSIAFLFEGRKEREEASELQQERARGVWEKAEVLLEEHELRAEQEQRLREEQEEQLVAERTKTISVLARERQRKSVFNVLFLAISRRVGGRSLPGGSSGRAAPLAAAGSAAAQDGNGGQGMPRAAALGAGGAGEEDAAAGSAF